MTSTFTAFIPDDPIITKFATDYEKALSVFLAGNLDSETFRAIRIGHGIHSQRPPLDTFMVRIKLPYGALTSQQLRTLAQIARETPEGLHITSRESIEFHGVSLINTAFILQRAAEAGLTGKEAGGNSIRNVAACPLAGVCPYQPFNMLPSIQSFVRSEIGHPTVRMLPRKLKVAFSGCAKDCTLSRLHDVGAVAIQKSGQPGFRIYVGGGMGGQPVVGKPFAAFVPASSLPNLTLSIALVFDRLGERRNRERARLKFLIHEIGLDRFRSEVRKTYSSEHLDDVVWSEDAVAPPAVSDLFEKNHRAATQSTSTWYLDQIPEDIPSEWVHTSVRRQLPLGKLTVLLSPRNGDLSPSEAEHVADLADIHGAGKLAVTQSQQILLRNVPESMLTKLYKQLVSRRLVQPATCNTLRVVSCPGAETCNLALTRSRDLAAQLRRHLGQLPPDIATAVGDLDFGIRINGCAHSCCHIRVAPLGLMGSTVRINHQSIPMYTLLLGGHAQGENVRWSTPVIRIPARRIPDAVERLLRAFHSERTEAETFSHWAARRFALPAEDATAAPSVNRAEQRAQRLKTAEKFFIGLEADKTTENAELLQDWGSTDAYSWSVGRAECDNMPLQPATESTPHSTIKQPGNPAWEVTAEQVKTWLDDPTVRLVDVRTRDEYNHGHIPGTEWIPVNELGQNAAGAAFHSAICGKVVFICRTGHRSMDVCTTLRNAGLTKAFSLQGGILSWQGAWASADSNHSH